MSSRCNARPQQERKAAVAHYTNGGLGSVGYLMGFFASMLAYLGTAVGIVAALLLSLTAFLTASPDQATITHQAAAAAAPIEKPAVVAAAAADSTSNLPPRPGMWGPSVIHSAPEGAPAPVPKMKTAAFGRRRPHLAKENSIAKEASREQFPFRLDRYENPKRVAYRQEPSFANRYLGYVDDPSADQSRLR